ncbi:hypothetical protein JCM10449v2_006877 [Rhodotorula kratochvilovae]
MEDQPMKDAQPQPQDPPKPKLGRRAQLTQDVLLAASNRVIKVLDDKAMRQCFPQQWADAYPDLIPGLRDIVLDTYTAGVPLAWDDLARAHDFVNKANALDALLADAQARKDRGEPPRELYQKGLDAALTVPSATVPVLQSATDSLRAKREALAVRNAETYKRIAALAGTAESLEAQNEAILEHFNAEMDALKAVDEDGLKALQEQLVAVVGAGTL